MTPLRDDASTLTDLPVTVTLYASLARLLFMTNTKPELEMPSDTLLLLPLVSES